MYWVSKGLLKPTKINVYTENENYDKKIKSKAPVLKESSYFLKDSLTGEVFNHVTDITIFKPIPF